MTHVVVVDDEQRVLAGLRRQLHPRRDEWELTFLSSGEDALAGLAARPADVLVTDMRMPGMDGAQLLARVAREHQRVARLVLSGQAEPEQQLAARGRCHGYLVKPCPAEQLEGAIRQALAVRAALDALQWTEGQRLWNASPLDEPASAALFGQLTGAADDGAAADALCAQLLSDTRLASRLELVLGERAPAPPGSGSARPLVALALAIRLRERVAGAEECGSALLAAARAADGGRGPGPRDGPAVEAATATLLALPGPDRPGPGRRDVLEFLLPVWGFSEPVVAVAARSPAGPPDRPHLTPSARR